MEKNGDGRHGRKKKPKGQERGLLSRENIRTAIRLGGKRQRTEKVKDKFQVLFPVCLYRSTPNLNGSIQISEEQVGFGHDYSERLRGGT